jgi:predicted 2-oxoglutarate/Fe(II)-dependent dioxygenase YbiX
MTESGLYVIAREAGAENPAIPTWANHTSNPAALQQDYTSMVERMEVESVPGAFQLLNVLSADECASMVQLTESVGFNEDAAVSLPRSVRHNHSMTWVVDDETSDLLWGRCEKATNADTHLHGDHRALGLNNRFRFYRYQQGDFFGPHTDGAWPGSRVIDDRLVPNAFDDRYSQLTFLLFLSDGYEGGETRFYLDQRGSETVDVRTPLGGALCFPHGTHPLHCVHGSQEIFSGNKYIIRSDVLFEI